MSVRGGLPHGVGLWWNFDEQSVIGNKTGLLQHRNRLVMSNAKTGAVVYAGSTVTLGASVTHRRSQGIGLLRKAKIGSWSFGRPKQV